MYKGKYKAEIRVGVPFIGLCCWQGGIDFGMNYFLRVLNACPFHRNKKVIVFCYIPINSGTEKGILATFIKEMLLGFGIKKSMPSIIVVYCNGKKLESLFKKHKIDIVLPLFGNEINLKDIPYIGYIPDVQHRHLQEFFSKKEIQEKDKRNVMILNRSRYVIANSNSVKMDFDKFYAPYSAKVFVLPYYPIASIEHLAKDNIKNIRRKYNLPLKYFLVSNQFWMHKNHLLTFEAFDYLFKIGYKDIYLVCTGKMEDYRNEKYVENLLRKLRQLDCARNIMLLGVIPKKEQLCIMRNAIALIQPTRFEGGPGGGAVYDAISMQIPCIVSDIEVNKEIPRSERIYYFDVNSKKDLGEKMEYVIQKKHKKISKRVLEKRKLCNMERYADFLYGVIDKVIMESKNISEI